MKALLKQLALTLFRSPSVPAGVQYSEYTRPPIMDGGAMSFAPARVLDPPLQYFAGGGIVAGQMELDAPQLRVTPIALPVRLQGAGNVAGQYDQQALTDPYDNNAPGVTDGTASKYD